jgi:phospholipase A1
VLLVFRNSYSLGGWHGRLFGFGVNHQSNGRADPISRSWNRIVANIGLDRDNWAVMVRPWWRIPDGHNADENPGIEDYIGRGDVTIVHHWNDHEFALMARHSLRTWRQLTRCGAIRLGLPDQPHAARPCAGVRWLWREA